MGRSIFAGEDVGRATAGVGSRLPIDRTMFDPEVGVKPDGRIPASAVCPWDVHPVGVSSGRTMGIIDGIFGLPRRIYVTCPLLYKAAHERGKGNGSSGIQPDPTDLVGQRRCAWIFCSLTFNVCSLLLFSSARLHSVLN